MQSIHSDSRGFTGAIRLRLTDLIQMVCLARSDLVIEVASSKGEGSIHIRQGRIRHAQADRLTGTEAFFEIIQWDDGKFEILPYENNVIDSVNKPWEHLLLEAMRQQDEKKTESGEGADGASGPGGLGQDPGPDILLEIDDVLGDPPGLDRRPGTLRQARPVGPEDPKTTVKVLVVDDSAFFSKKLRNMLEIDHAIEVAGIAANGEESLEFLKSGAGVDLITLDVNMPIMPGDTTLKHIMIHYRTPVIIISSMAPDSIHKVLDFLHLGAVDYIAKPGVHDDFTLYGAKLRKLVMGAAKSRISNFKRLRLPNHCGESPGVEKIGSAGKKVLVIVGAEGAHMDWLRLPLARLCGDRPVIGLQKLEDGLALPFTRFIGDKAGIETEYLSAAHEISPGKLYLSDARRGPEFRLGPERLITVDIAGPTVFDWRAGMELWLERLAEKLGDSMCVFCMSAAQPVSESLLSKLFDYGVGQILAPPESVVCSQMIESIKPYAAHFPGLVRYSSLDALMEALKKQ